MSMNLSIFRIPSSESEWFKNASYEVIEKKIGGPELAGDRLFETEIYYAELHYVLTGTESGGRGPRSLIMNEYGEPMKHNAHTDQAGFCLRDRFRSFNRRSHAT